MTSPEPLLKVSGLTVAYQGLRATTRVVRDVSFEIASGEILGLVGESGSGKSVTSLAIMRLLGDQGRIETGEISFTGSDLAKANEAEMLSVRGRAISMIFQDPMSSLNPVLGVGFQIAEVLVQHLKMAPEDAMRRAIELMAEVGIPAAASRARDYPHQLSGGMRQRVMIAMALACAPRLLIADEPTTALDVTIQAQILDLIRRRQRELGSAVLLITHDMGVVAEMVDRIIVMYAGEVVEEAEVTAIFDHPRHPYTRLLLRAIPTMGERRPRLAMIDGAMPAPAMARTGCAFAGRCPFRIARCAEEAPVLRQVGLSRVRCHRAEERLELPVEAMEKVT